MAELSSLFSTLLTVYGEINEFNGSHSSEEFNGKVKNACSLCMKAVEMVNELQLFSKNESLDDLTSTETRYLIIPALCGYFFSHRNDDRLKNIRLSLTLYKEFSDLCSSYGVCKPVLNTVKLGTAQPSNVFVSREDKIKRYKEKKLLEEKMESLASYVNQAHVDEEVKRDYNLSLVRHWALMVEDEYPTLSQEEQLLSLSPEQLKVKDKPSTQSSDSLKPFILTRTAAQAAVFGTGYPSLPTMSVDEFVAEQTRRGYFPAPDSVAPVKKSNETFHRYDPTDAEREKEEKHAAEDDALAEADDEKRLQRARAMDEFKDEHRRGSGNRMNRA